MLQHQIQSVTEHDLTLTGTLNIIKARFLALNLAQVYLQTTLCGKRANLTPLWDRTKNTILEFNILKRGIAKQSFKTFVPNKFPQQSDSNVE